MNDSQEGLNFYLYKTINTVNGKYYIGVHYRNPNTRYDYYLGSGSALKKAIKKYGKSAFVQEILEKFRTAEEAYAQEEKVVTEALVLDPMCYNEKVGGRGGMRGRKMPEEEKERIRQKLKGRVLSEETRKKLSAANKGKKRTPEQIKQNSEGHKGKRPSEETREKLRQVHSHPRADWIKERIRQGKIGHTVSLETRQKISKAGKGRILGSRSEEVKQKIGEKNKGRVYVNNGKQVKHIYPIELEKYLEQGWVVGKKLKISQ